MNEFDDIRCYNDDEVNPALMRLMEEKQFMKIVSTVYPLLPKETLKQRLSAYKTAYDFQKGFVVPFLKDLEANLTKGIELRGLDKTDIRQSYLYISNHRDIILDSAFLCSKLIENNLDTVEIAIGDNLLVFPWIKELVRVNKSFIVNRGLSARQILESSKHLSAYIRYSVLEKKQSVWLAQREGRAKDSNDRTQESLLKMLNMSGTADLATNLSELRICPLSISYEYDPCDYLKAKEFQQKRDNPEYKKQPQDDLLNMQTGVMGYKGKVVYTMVGDMSADLKEMKETIANKNELVTAVAALIDRKIHSHYAIYAVNKIAYDLLSGTQKFAGKYTVMQKLDFEKYLAKQLDKIDLPDKDIDFLMQKMLEMYANPLKNYLEATA